MAGWQASPVNRDRGASRDGLTGINHINCDHSGAIDCWNASQRGRGHWALDCDRECLFPILNRPSRARCLAPPRSPGAGDGAPDRCSRQAIGARPSKRAAMSRETWACFHLPPPRPPDCQGAVVMGAARTGVDGGLTKDSAGIRPFSAKRTRAKKAARHGSYIP
jgi:hypothetical protein